MGKWSFSRRAHWELFPVLIVIVTLAALSFIANISERRIQVVAQELASEDVKVVRWWYERYKARLNNQVAYIARWISEAADLESLAREIGLTDQGVSLAWIATDGTVKMGLNASALPSDLAGLKMFSYAQAVGKPVSDLWRSESNVSILSMAPVSEEKGGGVVVMQTPFGPEMMDELAALTERDVMLLSFERQERLLSSDPSLMSKLPLINADLMKEVATSQTPGSTRVNNEKDTFILGIIAIPDFAGIGFSGYLLLVERSQAVTGRLPQSRYAVLIFLSVVSGFVGCVILHRNMKRYLPQSRKMTRAERRSFKLRMASLLALFLLPAIISAGYMLSTTSDGSRELDVRSTQIAQKALRGTMEDLRRRIEGLVTEHVVTSSMADSPDRLADLLRWNELGFAIVHTDAKTSQVGAKTLPSLTLQQLENLASSQVALIKVDDDVLLAGKLELPDDGWASFGYRLGSYLKALAQDFPADISLYDGNEPLVTTLSERQIATISFNMSVEEQLRQQGEAFFAQKIRWIQSKLAVYALHIGDDVRWRLVVSQPSTIWLNSITAYKALGSAVLVMSIIIVCILAGTTLYQDNRVLLHKLYTGYLFIMPAFIWLVWWRLGPVLFAGYLSFHKWSVLDPAKPFVGLHNFRLVLHDEKFWNAMKNTVVYLIQIPIGMVISLGLALALNRKIRGIRFLRTIYYMPAVTSMVVVSLMWQWIYNKDFGVLNYFLSFLGLGPYGWLQSTKMALPSIMLMAIWLGLGSRMLLFLAGLQSIPEEYYEAAEVDGADAWNRFWHITLPLLAPTTFFVLVTSIIGSFQVFTPVYVLTGGGPAGSTDVAVHRIYFEAWQNLRFGYASAETWILFAILFVLTLIQFRYFGRRIQYV